MTKKQLFFYFALAASVIGVLFIAYLTNDVGASIGSGSIGLLVVKHFSDEICADNDLERKKSQSAIDALELERKEASKKAEEDSKIRSDMQKFFEEQASLRLADLENRVKRQDEELDEFRRLEKSRIEEVQNLRGEVRQLTDRVAELEAVNTILESRYSDAKQEKDRVKNELELEIARLRRELAECISNHALPAKQGDLIVADKAVQQGDNE